MSNRDTLVQEITDIADAIRLKLGGSSLMTIDQMCTKLGGSTGTSNLIAKLKALGNATRTYTKTTGNMTLVQMKNAILAYNPFNPSDVKWATSSWEDIATLLQKHYAGELDIANYWAVGDSRSISLPAMAATGVGESHVAQTVEWVVADFNKIPLTSSQKTSLSTSKTTAAVVFTQRHFLSKGTAYGDIENGYMNSSRTNRGGWNACARRTWCNNVYKSALPSGLNGLLKEVSIVTGTGAYTTENATSSDYIFLPAEKEIFGSVIDANSTAESSLSQWQWFATSGNRVKKGGSSSGYASNWWERSPASGTTVYFCVIQYDGSANSGGANQVCGIAPSGCI